MLFKYLFLPILFVFQCLIPSYSQVDAGKWELLECTGKPEARHENSFVELNGKFYLLGGRKIKPVNIFDPAKNTWTSGAKPPIEIHHFQGAAYNGKIYVIGAMTGRFPNEKPLSNILIYNPQTDAWEQGDEIPEKRRRGSSGIVVKGDKIFIISGIVDGHNGTHVSWVDQYNFKTGDWKELSDAPRARDHFSAAMYKGDIYCVGGRNTSNNTKQTFELTIAEMDVYNIKKDKWVTLPASSNIPTERAGTSTVMCKNDLMVIGGESGTQSNAHDEVEAYNIKSKQWRKLSPLFRGRHGTQAILYDQNIFIAAGSGNRGGTPELDIIEKYECNSRK